jgi:uncharacterized circularly permuted ATP-grasp superfamily protein
MSGEAIARYHELLTPQVAAETEGALNEQLRSRKCYFGTRPLCTVLRPNFYSPEAWAYVQHETGFILRACEKAHAACMRDPMMRAQLDLEPYEEALFDLDIGFRAPWTTSRLDSFFDPEAKTLRFVEYNAETPAGMAYEDQLSEAFLELESMKRFAEHYHVKSLHVRHHLLNALLNAYREYGGQNAPQIAIIDWADVPTLNEHELCKEYFEAHGCKTLLADPRALEYHHGHLWAGDFRIDLIYKRVLCSELVMRMGIDNAVVKAVADRAVCMSNAFSSKLMAKKASFAFVSDERNGFLFSDEERQAIEAHIPWTRRVQDRRTDYHGQQVDLLAFVAHHRENFVLKPNDDYGGKGVVIGWEVSEEEWGATLQHGLTTPYVVQERAHATYLDFPSIVEGQLDISPRLVDADPFIFNGQATHGCLTRLSTSSLLNVTAGGGSVVPTFVIEPR